MKTRRTSFGAGMVLAAALLATTLAGCGSTSTDSGAPDGATDNQKPPNGVLTGPADQESLTGGKLVYGMEAEPEGLDPTRYAFSQAGNLVASAVFDPIATLDADAKPVPYLATAIEPDADFTSWTITLPEGVTFHDGTPLTAQVVADDLIAFHNSLVIGPSMKGWFSSAAATDPTHVQVKTLTPFRAFPTAMATQLGYVFAPSMLTDASLSKAPVGSGPFVFRNHEDGKVWSFEKNPNYRQPGLPKLDAIDFVPVVNELDRLAKLQSGDLDLMQTIGTGASKELPTDPSYKVVESRGDKAFLMLNMSKPPFDSLTARRAVAYATDSAGWRKEVFADVTTPANSPFGLGQLGYLADNGFPSYDPAKAKELVAQYQQETGLPLEFTFIAAADATNAAYAQYFLPAFEAAGIKVTVVQKPQINLLASVASGDYQLSQFRLFANPDPRIDSTFYRSDAIGPISLNFPRFSNQEVDDIAVRTVATGDPAEVDRDLQQVSRIMADQVPFVWLGQTHWLLAANDKVNGVGVAANGVVPTLTPHTYLATLSRSK